MPKELNELEEIQQILKPISDFFFDPTKDPTMAQVFGKATQQIQNLLTNRAIEELEYQNG